MSKIAEENEEKEKTFLESMSKVAVNTTTTETAIKSNSVLEKMEILYGSDNIIKRTIDDIHKIKEKFDNCVDSTGPSVFFNTPIWKEFVALKNRGIKLRFITEITKDNIAYCKELMKIANLRHLDGIKGNFGIADGKDYGGSSSIKEGQPPRELVRSNVKTFVEQQQFFFETLWSKAVPVEQKIKEIEEGKTFRIWTRLLENEDEIIKEVFNFNSAAEKLSICTTSGGLEMSHNYLLDSYEKLLRKNRDGKIGLRIVLVIDDESVHLVKKLLDLGVKIRHIKNFLPMSFGVSEKDVAITVEKMEGGKHSKKFLLSTEPLYVDHFNNVFEDLWNNGIDAKRRIKSIEDGFGLEDVEIIYNSTESIKRAWNMVKLAKEEVLLLFSSSNALQRQLKMGVTKLLEDINELDKVKLKILIPNNNDISKIISEIKLKFPSVDIRPTDEKLKTKITILVTDRKESIVWEVKDDSSEISSFEAVGIAAYTNIKAISLSYASIFDSLWVQTDMYEKLKQTEQLQKEFLDVAAHELRTPIQPIINIVDILRSDLKNNNNRNFHPELLDIAKRNAKRLMNLTESILDVARIESNTLQIKREVINLHEIVFDIIQYFTNGIEKHNNKKNIFLYEYIPYNIKRNDSNDVRKEQLKYYIKPYLPSTTKDNGNPNGFSDIFVNVDREKISQVLYNLLDNANKFTIGGKIFVLINVMGVDKNGKKCVIVSIKDSGTGINPDILPRLFNKFTSKSFQGTGLGLYISKKIVEAHGGKIWAENNKNEKGATFSFSLPLSK